jgi:hypothetical protein
MLLVVAGEVLDGSTDTVLLQSFDVRGGDRAVEERVFGKGLESLQSGNRSVTRNVEKSRRVRTRPLRGDLWMLQVGARRTELPFAFASLASTPPTARIASTSNVAPRAVAEGRVAPSSGGSGRNPVRRLVRRSS